MVEIRRLIELYVFSYLIGNGDLHAKNISLLADREGRIRLSPAYDLLSTLPYGDRSMALKFGAKDENFSLQDILSFEAIFGIPPRAVETAVQKLLVGISEGMNELPQNGLGATKSADIESTFRIRARQLGGK